MREGRSQVLARSILFQVSKIAEALDDFRVHLDFARRLRIGGGCPLPPAIQVVQQLAPTGRRLWASSRDHTHNTKHGRPEGNQSQ